MKEISIKITINPEEEFDLKIQREIAKAHRKVERIKQTLKEDYEKIINSKVWAE